MINEKTKYLHSDKEQYIKEEPAPRWCSLTKASKDAGILTRILRLKTVCKENKIRVCILYMTALKL